MLIITTSGGLENDGDTKSGTKGIKLQLAMCCVSAGGSPQAS